VKSAVIFLRVFLNKKLPIKTGSFVVLLNLA